MKKERKQELMQCFPCVTPELMTEMKGKNAHNFAVMLTHGDELFIRCYHRYTGEELVERQRYVFAKDGCCRYGSKHGTLWEIRTEVREPVFNLTSYGYNIDNSYTVLNLKAINRSCMKYSQADKYTGKLLIEYLKFYCRHPNVEYIMKQGYSHLIYEVCTGGWGTKLRLDCSDAINWKSDNLLKMLGLSRTEFAILKGSEGYYESYIVWRREYPKLRPPVLLKIAKIFSFEVDALTSFCERTGLTPSRISDYLSENRVNKRDYKDYLDQCTRLRYNLHDTAICMPRDFSTMHERLSEIIEYKDSEDARKSFAENYPDRHKLEFAWEGLILRQPESFDEIVAEGKALGHCVGSYAERHARGKLHILFIRTAEKPDVPYYTMEVSIEGKIVQCRGFGNNRTVPKPQAVIDFEAEYQRYLDSIYKRKKERKTA